MSQNRYQVYQNGIFQLLDVISPYFILNMAWFVLSLPIVTLIPATGGLYYATFILARDGDAGLGDLWHGFRTYFWKSWVWAGVNLLAYGIMLSNFWFYGGFEARWAIWVRTAVFIIIVLWTSLQLYTFPLLIMQEDKRLKVALRNSYIALVYQPLQSIAFTLVIIALVFLSTFFAQPSWVIITATLCLTISNRTAMRAIHRLHPELLQSELINSEDE